MASPVDLTAWLGAAGAGIGAAAAIVTVWRQSAKDKNRAEHDRDATDVASWTKLNSALDREIQRLRTEMDRMREDYERQLGEQETRHGRERALDRKRIEELERDVESLQRLLRGRDISP
jgi:predicted RNase H-like nuclease (RuvC/YqgF family)